LIQKEEYFAAARYQVGPRWAFFGGLLDSKYTLSNAQTKSNNSESKIRRCRREYATSAANYLRF